MVIIASVDRSARSADVIKQAGALAEVFDDTIHVVHVMTRSMFIDLERTSIDQTGDTVNPDQVREFAADIAADAAADLDVPFETIGLVGDPAPRIVQYANEQDARYLVVAGRKRSPTGKVVFGSVLQAILLNAPCPIVSCIEQPSE